MEYFLEKVFHRNALIMFKKIAPHPALDKNIEYYWIEESIDSKEIILPDGSMFIVFNLANPLTSVENNGIKHTINQEGYIIGPHKSYFTFENKSERKIIGIKFHHGTPFHLVKTSMSHFVDQVIRLENVINGKAISTLSKLISAKSLYGIKSILDSFLLSSIDRSKINPTVMKTIHDIGKYDHSISIKELSQNLNVSQKHLINLFKDQVGLSPKFFQRIVKFQGVISMVKNGNTFDWPELAYRFGYYDQAHLINDFKYFSGCSPKYYLKNNIVDGQRLWLQ